jgi:hypothetical protein
MEIDSIFLPVTFSAKFRQENSIQSEHGNIIGLALHSTTHLKNGMCLNFKMLLDTNS